MKSSTFKMVALVMLAVAGVAAADTGPAWKDFSSPEGRFSVLFPGTPTQNTQATPTQVGNVAAKLFTLVVDKDFYAVMYLDYPKEALKEKTPEQLLDGARDIAVNKAKGSLLGETKITANGSPGREVKMSAPNDQIGVMRMYMVNARFYYVLVVFPNSKDGNPDIRKFLDSFKFAK